MNRDPEARHEIRAWTLLLLAGGLVWFAVLGVRPLFNPDEGRYAQIPAEMLASGDYTVPHLDGLVYLEKPPLQYWATALALAAFGHNAWAARLVAATSAVIALVFLFLLGRRAWDAERGLTGAAMAASMLLYVFMGQLLTLDMMLSCWLTIASVAFCLAQLERDLAPARTRRWMLVCWGAMAAATLTKGLVGIVLPGAVLVLYTLLQRDRAAWRHLHLGKGLALYAALVVPWFVLVERAHPGAFDFLIVREHFQRYLTTVHDRYKPWWYFLMVLAGGSLPWLPQVTRALLSGWRRSRPRGEFDAARVLWVSAAFTLAFFSLSDSKLAPYIVPVLPPLALLGAAPGPAAGRDLKLAALLQVLFGIALGIAVVVYGRRPLVGDPAWTYATLKPWIVALALLLVAGGATALALRGRGLGLRRRIVAATGFAFALALIAGGADAIARRYSAAPLLAAAGPLAPGATLYTVNTFDWTLLFYAARPVVPVAYRGELDYGLAADPARGLATLEEFKARWQPAAAAYALVPHATAAALASEGVPMRVLAEDFDNVLVSRR
ncbi:MAG TPA: glycosyltransferase family 39 protein [Steroidobacteraceae bacterium]|nr:glycosyltransferase family 39 protein [Steroidobacteraceae bacterium]